MTPAMSFAIGLFIILAGCALIAAAEQFFLPEDTED